MIAKPIELPRQLKTRLGQNDHADWAILEGAALSAPGFVGHDGTCPSTDMTLTQAVEALLFSAHKPLSARELRDALTGRSESDQLVPNEFAQVKEPEIAGALEQLKIEYLQQMRGFMLSERAEGWQLVSHPDCARWVRQLFPETKPARLSPPALETLAIVAYRQPITRADIEAIRGVSVDGVLQNLMERGLVKISGRAELPGRPLLYETTLFFLEHFGLRNLDELPNAEELRSRVLPRAQEEARIEVHASASSPETAAQD